MQTLVTGYFIRMKNEFALEYSLQAVTWRVQFENIITV